MKKLDKNLKVGLVSLIVFVAFLAVFSALSGLVQSKIIPDFAASQRVQGILAVLVFLPLILSMLFLGKHFKSKGSQIGGVLIFSSIALLAFGVLQVLLSLLGVYGA